MAHNNGKITAPVSIRDVQLTLGESIGVLAPKRNNLETYDLCGSPNINIWSRIKPCRYDSLDKMVPHEFTAVADPEDPNKGNVVLSAQTLTPITNGTTGIIFPTMMKWSDITTLRSDYIASEKGEEYAVQYRHDFPTGWDGKHYYASRLKDFDGYDHYAPIPFSLSIEFVETTFTATIGLNTDNAGVFAKTFDYNIYKNIIWRLAVAVGTGTKFDLYMMKDPDVTQQNQYLYSNGFLGTMGDNQTEFSISGDVKGAKTTYTFIGMLIAYKVKQNIGSDNQPITETISPIRATSEDSTMCGIPMPCANVTAMSGIIRAKATIATIKQVIGVPTYEDNIIGTGDYYIEATVIWSGGSEGYTFGTNHGIFFDDGSTDGLIKNGIKVRKPIVLGAYETKTMQYYYRTNKKGVRTYTVSVKRAENGSEVIIATKSEILDIKESTIIG